ncbi:MAG: Gfo/Idh/MocA family oxidoreductase [Campylobacterota bacterium]|nr:Gfo/Idh/MocA family oxidoreductase [Campylobacterota bacterium]
MGIKLCQVGLGYWGRNLLRNLSALGHLAVAYDLNEKTVDKYRKDSVYRDIKFGTNYTECLDRLDINGVVIATPPDSHYQIALMCLNKGKHVFVEKPLTLLPKESKALVRLAKEKNLVLSVGHIFLYSPEIIKLKEVINSEAFGAVKYIYTQRLNLGKIQECGVVFDLAAHDISIVDYLLDDYCVETKVSAKSHIIAGVEDVAFISMNYSKGTFCNLHLSWLDPSKIRNLTVVGDKQMAVCDSTNKKVDVYNSSVDIMERSKTSNESFGSHLLSYSYGDVISKYIENTEPMKLELEDFVSCIKTGEIPVANGDVGSSVVRVMDAMKSSMMKDSGWTPII